MKTIGMLGGMSWESTANYYKSINEKVKKQLGGLHSAKIVLYSVDFDEIEKLQHQGKWADTASILANAAISIEKAGADVLLICTNTMHKVASDVSQNIAIPLLHIADATAKQLVNDKITKVGLLGTRFTIEQDFYKGRITDSFGIDVVIPDDADITLVHNVIYQELCLGKVLEPSKEKYLAIIDEMHKQGAQAIILGCTEIAMLVKQRDTAVPLYDTTEIHAQAAVDFALSN